LCFRSQTTEKI